MQKTTIKTKNKAEGISRRIRKHPVKRRAIKPSPTGRRELLHGTNAAASRVVVPFALKPVDKELPFITVSSLQGENTEYGNEKKQLQILQDIYPIISSMKGFEAIDINENNTTADLLHALFKQFDSIGKFERWSLEKTSSSYQLKALNIYKGEDPIYIAVDFLSQINRSHKRLHDFIIWAIRLAYNTNCIPMFSDWCHNGKYAGTIYEYLLERKDDMESEDQEYRKKYYDALEYYGSKGIPSAYCKILYSGGASLIKFKQKLSEFKPENEFEEIALPFLQATLVLAETKKKMYDYCNEPYEAGEAKPNDYMQIIWTYDDDIMAEMFHECIDSMANGCGIVGFCWEAIIENGGTFNNQGGDFDFCDKIEAFFETGQDMSLKIKKKLSGIKQQPPLPIK